MKQNSQEKFKTQIQQSKVQEKIQDIISRQNSKRKTLIKVNSVANNQFTLQTPQHYRKQTLLTQPSEYTESTIPFICSDRKKDNLKDYQFSYKNSTNKDIYQYDKFGRKVGYSSQEKNYESGIKNKMKKTFMVEINDMCETHRFNSENKKKFYRQNKQLYKQSQLNDYYQIQDSCQTNMLKSQDSQQINPNTLNIYKNKGKEVTLKLTNMKIGDQYSTSLGKGLKVQPDITSLKLSDNRLSQKSFDTLVSGISKNIKKIDLSKNKINNLGLLKNKLDEFFYLSKIDISANNAGNTQINKIIAPLINSSSIKILKIGRNQLSDYVIPQICTLLGNNMITELYLQWNQFSTEIKQVFDVLCNVNSLKVLDVSGNTIGNNPQLIKSICSCLVQNESLLHLDLSICNFNYSNSILISQALEKNHTIYGFHFAGNYGYVDNRGFLIVTEYQGPSLQMNKKEINSVKPIIFNQTIQNTENQCWICNNWVEVELNIFQKDPTFVAFQFENYQINYTNNQQQYYRVLPTFPQNFAIVQNKQVQIQPDYNEISIDKLKLKYYDNTYIENIQQVNQIKPKGTSIIDPNTYQPLIISVPRVNDPEYIPQQAQKEKEKWTFPISIMARWRQDTPQINRQCFENDWNYGILQNLVKRENEEVKEFLASIYKDIRNMFKYYSSYSPVGDIWAIQKYVFDEMVLEHQLEEPHHSSTEIDLKYTACISKTYKGNFLNPVQAISRYQLMEVLSRIAFEKYIDKKITQSYIQAIKNLWNNFFKNKIQMYDIHQWRIDRYYHENIDIVLKHYKKVLDLIYSLNSGKKVKPGQKIYMSLEEFENLCIKSRIAEEESFGTTTCKKAFCFSLQTIIDDVQNDQVFQMKTIEFYEAIARLAEELSLATFGIDIIEQNIEKRKKLPLEIKLECLIYNMIINNLKTKNFQDYLKTSLFCQIKH